MAWRDMISIHHYANLLDKHFFPKWLQVSSAHIHIHIHIHIHAHIRIHTHIHILINAFLCCVGSSKLAKQQC